MQTLSRLAQDTSKEIRLEELRKLQITLKRSAHTAVGPELTAFKNDLREVEVLILQVKKGG